MLLTLILTAAPLTFEPLGDGLEHAKSGTIDIIRVDPARARVRLGLASQEGSGNHTTAKWADLLGCTLTVNAGMYDKDLSTNMGHLHAGAHVNRERWNEYQSVLLISKGKPSIVDRDASESERAIAAADTVVQNLRLIKAPGTSVWATADRKWSEAALAMDKSGRLLVLFTREAKSMVDFNAEVLALPLGITRAMHLDGGPPAALSLRTRTKRLDLVGTYETGFFERTPNDTQWDIPNVICVQPSNSTEAR